MAAAHRKAMMMCTRSIMELVEVQNVPAGQGRGKAGAAGMLVHKNHNRASANAQGSATKLPSQKGVPAASISTQDSEWPDGRCIHLAPAPRPCVRWHRLQGQYSQYILQCSLQAGAIIEATSFLNGQGQDHTWCFLWCWRQSTLELNFKLLIGRALIPHPVN